MSTSFTVTGEDLSFFFGETLPHLDERQRRIITGAAARTLGHGGVKAVAVASGLSLSTVQNGALTVDAGIEQSDRVRAPGAGRKLAEKSMPGLVDALDGLVEPGSRGDPECALRWTTKSTRNLADELTEQGFAVTHSVVAKLLATMGYSLQAARKSAEGSDHPDRDAQFRYLTGLVEQFRAAGEPVISVDTKKKLRHEVAYCERTRRSEVRRDVGCVVPGECSGPVPALTCVASNCGVRSSGKKPKRVPFHPGGAGKGKAGRVNESESLLMPRYCEPRAMG